MLISEYLRSGENKMDLNKSMRRAIWRERLGRGRILVQSEPYLFKLQEEEPNQGATVFLPSITIIGIRSSGYGRITWRICWTIGYRHWNSQTGARITTSFAWWFSWYLVCCRRRLGTCAFSLTSVSPWTDIHAFLIACNPLHQIWCHNRFSDQLAMVAQRETRQEEFITVYRSLSNGFRRTNYELNARTLFLEIPLYSHKSENNPPFRAGWAHCETSE